MPFVERPGARIHYTVEGGGPAVLLVQGVGVAATGWQPQADALRQRYRVVSIDNRGVGRSSDTARRLSVEAMADDVLAVADAEGIGTFHLAGHSMGGIIAQQVALTAPHRVLSLALLCTFLRGRQATALSLPLLLAAIRARLGSRRMRRRAFVEMVMPRDYLARVDRDELCDRLERLFGRDLATQPPMVMRQLRAMSRFDAAGRLRELAGIPTLVVSADEDMIARPSFGRELAAAIPGARFVAVPAAGHAATIQCADAVNGHLLAHLAAGGAPQPS